MSWFALIVLALYNLHKRSEGVSRRGYFHWKSHICNFIDKHWNILFEPSVRRKRTWMGTVSGTLSHSCPTYFLSGTEELREPGWWRIAHTDMTPQQIVEIHSRNQAGKKKLDKTRGGDQQWIIQQIGSPVTSTVEESSMSAFEDVSNVNFTTLRREKKIIAASSSGCVSSAELRKASNTLCGFTSTDSKEVLPDLLLKDEHLPDMDVDVEEADSLCFGGTSSDGFQDLDDFLSSVHSYSTESSRSSFLSILPDITACTEDHLPLFSLEDTPLQSPSWKHTDDSAKKDNLIVEREEAATNEESNKGPNQTQDIEPVVLQSLFVHTPVEQRTPPWRELEERDRERLTLATQARCVQMSEYEELQLLSQLRQASKTQELPGFARRLYRKLCVRQQKRQRGLPIFNLDNSLQQRKGTNHQRSVWEKPDQNSSYYHTEDAPILDRFYHVPMKLEDKSQRQNCSFKIRLMGYSEPTCFLSPYTQRQLKPFIRRDYETTPRWLKLLTEIQTKANKNNSNWKPPQRSPIDYCYVRPQHISTVNSLCCEFFYPGIDLSETLQYPDFSCVVLYKKLIIAFAFMVPDSGYNETYITFLFTRPEWRGAGIATFMLYHLIQTCMGKDITLHVSATNPAVILYQKFGFKIEEFILDFYDKYLPADSQECKHALFLRLSR